METWIVHREGNRTWIADANQMIAEVFSDGHAKIIASAPALLDELKRVADFFEDDGYDCDDVRAVIAIAEER